MKNKINIFIVEDNKVFSTALQADIEIAFAHQPVKVNSFSTGEACMEKVKEEKPDIVIMDYHLNSLNSKAEDGIGILDKIKKENPATNVIILTSDDNIEVALKSFHHGASDYVVKTETKFKKINYSLFNLIGMMEAKREASKYKRMVAGLFVCLILLTGIVISIEFIKPSVLD